MKRSCILSAMVLVLLASRDSFALSSEFTRDKILTKNPKIIHSDVYDGRFLRTTKTSDESASKSGDNEERGLFSGISSWAKTKYWLKAGKSEDYVANALGLKGLTREAQVAHPNYKYFQKFLYNAEGRKLDDWVKKGDNIDTVWERFGLRTVPLDQLKNSEKFRVYLRFSKRYDDHIWSQWQEGLNKDSIWTTYQYLNKGQKHANVIVWAKANRPKSYVKQALGLDYSGANYEYYMYFLRLTGRI